MLEGEDPKGYYSLLSELFKNKLKGLENFQKTVVKVLHMINQWKVTREITPGRIQTTEMMAY